ncbi:hypothetical protein SprV_0401563700 [Sparganum proliferum]
MCPRCQRTFRAQIGLIGHLQINCTSRTAPTVVPPPASSSSSPPPTNSDCSSEPPLPSSSSSSTAPTTAAMAAVAHDNTIHISGTTTDITPATTDSRGEDQDNTCPHCDRTFTSNIGLVGHLRILKKETRSPGRSCLLLQDYFLGLVSSLENPSHRDWRTSAWSTNLGPPRSTQLPTLPSHFHATHGPIRPHAHP